MVDYSLWQVQIVKEVPGSIDGVLSYFPTYIKILYNTNMNKDFSDLRFSLTDGTALDYCITNMENENFAEVLVLIPSIPAAPASMNINIYWDNPMALSESNPDKVYILQDDFTNNVLDVNKWTLDSGTATIADSILTLTNPINNWLGISSLITNIDMCSVEMRLKSNDRFMIGLSGQYSTATGDVIVLTEYNGVFEALTCIDESCDDNIKLPTFLDYHVLRFDVNTNTLAVEVFYDDVSQGVTTIDVPTGPFQFMATQLVSSMEIDYIKILKFTPNPPVMSDVGMEYFVPDFQIVDEWNNPVTNILFESMYPKSVNKKTFYLKANDYSLRDVNITIYELLTDLIPQQIQQSSIGSTSYISLSLNDADYTDTLYINSIQPHETVEIHVKCETPNYVPMGGSFICGLKADAISN